MHFAMDFTCRKNYLMVNLRYGLLQVSRCVQRHENMNYCNINMVLLSNQNKEMDKHGRSHMREGHNMCYFTFNCEEGSLCLDSER